MQPFDQYAQIAAQVLNTAPQTQQDLHQIAETSQYVQSPQFQGQVQEVKTAAAVGGGTVLFLQLVQTAALIYIAYQLYKRSK